MKKILLVLISLFSLLTLVNCNVVFYEYNYDDLETMAKNDYGFSSVLFFKVVDVDTALELTGKIYNDSGIIYGIKDNEYRMIFVPKLKSEKEFVIDYSPIYDVTEIYQILESLEDGSGNKLFIDIFGDYGALSISVLPYESISNKFDDLDFDSPIFFIITTDELTFNVGRVEGNYIVFDQDLNRLN